jgi:16S rRNA (cytidine1402-2'-O)-methyltransferase
MHTSSSLFQAAADIAGHQNFPLGTLYVVATPIGNRADITLRGLHTLSLVDAIACEDTRNSGLWLQSLGLQKPLLSVHEHNEQTAAQSIIHRLSQGQRIAYISDAGTPAISDPGALLVQAVGQAGYRCIPIPGASSAAAALSVAGDHASESFIFLGFLPAKGTARDQAIQACAHESRTQILFEAPHRIDSLLTQLAQNCSNRRISIARELTKQYETIQTLTTDELLPWLQVNENVIKGEFVLILHSQPKNVATVSIPPEVEHTLACLLAELPLKQAVSLTTRITGHSRNDIYAWALIMKNNPATAE